MSQASVLIVEDDARTRERLARVIADAPDLRLLEAAPNIGAGLAALEREAPDVLLTDLDLPDGSGITLIRAVVERAMSTLPMVITVFGDEAHTVNAIEAGALGYLLKDGTATQVTAAIRDLLAGGSPISPPIARWLMRRMRSAGAARGAATRGVDGPGVRAGGEERAGAEKTAQRDGLGEGARDEVPHLSERELEVLNLIVKGFSYGEIAGLLGVSTHTVATHVRRIYQKLAVHSRSEAVYEAIQMGIVRVE